MYIYSYLFPLIHCFTHLLTFALTHSLTHTLTHALTHSLAHSLIHSVTHSLTHTLTHSLIHSLMQSFSPYLPPPPLSFSLSRFVIRQVLHFLVPTSDLQLLERCGHAITPERPRKCAQLLTKVKVYLTSPEPSKNCYNFLIVITFLFYIQTLTPLESSQLSRSDDILH